MTKIESVTLGVWVVMFVLCFFGSLMNDIAGSVKYQTKIFFESIAFASIVAVCVYIVLNFFKWVIA